MPRKVRSQYYQEKIKPFLEIIAADARRGLSKEEIAKNLGMTRKTLYLYEKDFEELREALKNGREEASKVVENELFKNAVGFEYIDKIVTNKKEVQYDENGKKISEKVEPVVLEVKKRKPGELGAQIFWLTNKLPEHWKNTQNIKHEGNLLANKLPDLSKLSVEELKQLTKLGDI